MNYTVETTDEFDKFLHKLKDLEIRTKIINRITKIQSVGHFGDCKSVGGELKELRFFTGAGYRIYYVIRNKMFVILLAGGTKDTQNRDIEKANRLLMELEEQ